MYYQDLAVEGLLLIELTNAKTPDDAEQMQCINFRNATGRRLLSAA